MLNLFSRLLFNELLDEAFDNITETIAEIDPRDIAAVANSAWVGACAVMKDVIARSEGALAAGVTASQSSLMSLIDVLTLLGVLSVATVSTQPNRQPKREIHIALGLSSFGYAQTSLSDFCQKLYLFYFPLGIEVHTYGSWPQALGTTSGFPASFIQALESPRLDVIHFNLEGINLRSGNYSNYVDWATKVGATFTGNNFTAWELYNANNG